MEQLRFTNPTNGRYYYIEKGEDDGLVIRIRYGGNRHHRLRNISCMDNHALEKELERLTKRRLRRGYILMQ